MSEKLSVDFGSKTILDLRHLQEGGHLNLEPGFQRKSVWALSDRRKLIESICEGFPVPSIFLYKREEEGRLIYDVLDGKQRLETIFMFTRVHPFKRFGFDVKLKLADGEQPTPCGWRALEQKNLAARFLSYKFQVAEVSGELSDIVDLFVRINSTGKALTSSEKRHARYYSSPMLKEADKLARRHREYLLHQRVMTRVGVDRMKDVELCSELLVSILHGGPIHKKQAVDKAVGNTTVPANQLARAVADFEAALRSLKQLFPELRTTRFHHGSEFYTLFMIVWEMQKQRNLALNDRRRNRLAMTMLREFSQGVDAVRELQQSAKGPRGHQQPYADYLLSVQQSTDALSQRTRRADMLRQLFAGLFEKRDDRRTFSPEQRRLIWNSEDEKVCTMCGEPLDWTNFQIDHIKAYARGGRTALSNAALMCAPCNAGKGGR